ncbi:MAG: hypothetical protein JW888_03455 [Pirellulales bacterium]|nr:hypothetical protein [Pirellulales bacterium]
MTDNLKSIAVAIIVLIILFPFGYSMVQPIVSQDTEAAEPFLDLPKGTCVAERTYMRYHHMDLLKEARDEAVREGKRGKKGLNGEEITINNCLKCHGNRERFCDRCHEAVNLHPNCFRCHFDPESVAKKCN